MRSGSEFYYLDSKNTTFSLYGNETSIQSENMNPLYKTLQQIYNTKQAQTYGMYNDQPPINKGTPKKPKNTGHTKDEIFKITKPWIYKGNGRYDETDSKVNGIFPFNSTGGDDLQVFAKSYSFGKDLYEDLVAGKLGDTLYTETWHSEYYCTDRVVDIEEIMFRDGYSFKSTQEHSKWAVTKHLNWTCIGDINRRESQFRRGGLTLCLNHAGVANEFRTLAFKLSNCNDRSGRKKNVCPEY
ncbi:deoxyribonuclease-2-alpha-like [Ostrea edulis]|uniref:deoxyribonuclease-2-alpha-like n=1 Tax=Ostrea edulis TaxID=37623 RepID=UPI0024AEE8BB|nr:deoxyribonuclease-2-alpha-like [Ostrea edulis]